MGTSLHKDPTGEVGGEVCLPGTSRDSKRGLWKWIGLSVCMGALRGAPLLGVLKKGSGNRCFSPQAVCWGAREGMLLYQGL